MKHGQLKNDMKDFESSALAGIIIELKDLRRGSYYLNLKQGAFVNHFVLPNFKQYIDRVQIGDSLYKPANSMFFQLYKKEGQKFAFDGEIKVEY